MKFKVTATIPTVQYGNLMPEIEVEAETYEEAQRLAMERIVALWNQYCEPGKQLKAANRVKLDAFVGGSIWFDPTTHTYTNEAGEVYLSGSAYAHQFAEPFDQVKISEAMAKKFGASAEDIVKLWELKAEISRGLGTALHAAMEMCGRYQGLAKQLERSAIHDNPMVMQAVQRFYEEHDEDAEYEVLVVDHAKKRAGRIDRLAGGWIEDFKTDVNIQKKLPIYQKQLSFYAAILEAAGKRVEGLRVHHWDGSQWTTYQLEKEAL